MATHTRFALLAFQEEECCVRVYRQGRNFEEGSRTFLEGKLEKAWQVTLTEKWYLMCLDY